MEFGLPSIKAKKQEKYEDLGVVTFLPTAPGKARKITFNTKALEMLNLTDEANRISFSFTGNSVYLVNTSGVDGVAGLPVSKTSKSISDKKHYEYVKYSINNSSEKDELELFLHKTENEFNGNTVYLLNSSTPQLSGPSASNDVSSIEVNEEEQVVLAVEFEDEDENNEFEYDANSSDIIQ